MLALGAQTALGAISPADSPVRSREFTHPGLNVETQLIRGVDTARATDLVALLIPAERAYLDAATGRWATLIPTQPLVPGGGVGNELQWSDLQRAAPSDEEGLAEAVEAAFRRYVTDFASELRISVDEFAGDLNVSVHDDTVLVHAPRVINGIPVRNSFVTATLSHGNLVLMGAARWADMNISPQPTLDEPAARQALDRVVSGLPLNGRWGDTELVIVPFDLGSSLGYRLAYSLKPSFDGEMGNYEGLVDAHSGELLSFKDTNHYATRHVIGGVYPETNDGDGPEGNEQPGWPMPYTDLGNGGFFTDGGGNFPGETGADVETELEGLYITINDNCGNVSESSSGDDDIDLRGSGGDDCTTPPGASNGNTHSARTSFYEHNRVAEWARTRWPSNSWLNANLQANVNINFSCNAFWSGSTNYFRSGFGCANTGEIAGVVDHEWGHGMDNNDNNPTISFPGEGIADIYAALRLNTSCIGRGFFDSGNCTGYGDGCLDCSGVRDIDWAKRESGMPHDPAWGDANCGGCSFGTVHCLGAIYAEAVWDLAKRDLPAAGFDSDIALEMATRHTIVGAGNVGTWFTCGFDGEDGCAAEGGYLNYIAADDIDGDLSNGTPRMEAIHAAFDRHGIACSAPVVQNNGCENAPSQAPVVSATAGDSEATLSWSAVPNADRYYVFRTEGVKQCDKGKIYVGSTASNSFTDTGLLNGFEYYYSVTTNNASGRSCVGPMSACTAVTPQ